MGRVSATSAWQNNWLDWVSSSSSPKTDFNTIAEQAEGYSTDSGIDGILKVFKAFRDKCEEYERTKNDDLKHQPALPTDEALLGIQGTFYPAYFWFWIAKADAFYRYGIR
jgi:hypothetical protein